MSQLQICEALAPKLGITDYNDKSDEEWVKFMMTKLSEEFNKAAPTPDKEPKNSEHKLLPTPSGKIEIYSQLIAEMKHPLIPPIPKYIETWESLNDPLAKKYPLQLITPHFKRRAHSQFDNLPWLRDLQKQALTINALDAQSRGIRDGDMVRIFNDRGEVIIAAEVTERIMSGVVALPEGAWYSPDENGIDRGGCANVLTRNVTSPAGAFPAHTALVQVEKAEK
jgi:anaerobic dimethyl sulfoxide reductase subunit A